MEEAVDAQRLSRLLRRALIPGEKVLMQARFPRIYTTDTFLRLFLFLYAGRWLRDFLVQHDNDLPEQVDDFLYSHVNFPLYVLGGCGVLIFIRRMVTKWTTEIVLTDRRLIYKRGLFFIEMLQMNFRRIGHSDVMQSMLGALLDYGSVYIQSHAIQKQEKLSGGKGKIILPNISNPYLFSRLIEDNRRRGYKINVDKKTPDTPT